ncbi:Hypothetical protein, putative, partial [Bodo saltans]
DEPSFQGEGEDVEGSTSEEEGPSVRLVITNVFLLHVFESICCRLGIVHQRRKLGAAIGRISASSAYIPNTTAAAAAAPSPSKHYRRYEQGNINPQHSSTLAALKDVEVPTDVMQALQVFLSLHVVPTPVTLPTPKHEVQFNEDGMPIPIPEDANPLVPFDITTDDDIWETVIQSTKEWLTILQVDETLFDVNVFRQLLGKLSPPYPVKRLTRTLREVTRDFVAVIKGAGEMLAVDASSSAKEAVDTLNMSRASTSLSTIASRSIGSAGSLRTLHRRAGERTSSADLLNGPSGRGKQLRSSAMNVSGMSFGTRRANSSMLPPRPEGNSSSSKNSPTTKKQSFSPKGTRGGGSKVGGSTPLVTVVSPTTRASGGASSYGGGVLGGGTIVSATFNDPPLARPTYFNIVPSRLVRQCRDTDVLPGVQPMEFGIEVGEPPITSTQARAVLQARCSHYLYTARELPVIVDLSGGKQTSLSAAVSATSSVSSSSLPLHLDQQKRDEVKRRTSGSTPSGAMQLPGDGGYAETVKRAAASRMTPGGKVRPDRNSVEAALHDARTLPLSRQHTATLSVSCAKSLTFPASRLNQVAKAMVGIVKSDLSTDGALVSRSFLPKVDANLILHASGDSGLQPLALIDPQEEWHMCLPRDSTTQLLRSTAAAAALLDNRHHHHVGSHHAVNGDSNSPAMMTRSPQRQLHQRDGSISARGTPQPQHGTDNIEDDDGGAATLRSRMITSPAVMDERLRRHQHVAPLQLDGIASSPLSLLRGTVDNASIRHATSASTTTSRPERLTARHATLLSLYQKKDSERNENEALGQYWQRLQALEFKLAVLRGGTMPPEELALWKMLWAGCHECMEEVFAVLKREATSISTSHKKSYVVVHSQQRSRSTSPEQEKQKTAMSHAEHSLSELDDLLGEPIFALALVDSAVAAALVLRIEDLQDAAHQRKVAVEGKHSISHIKRRTPNERFDDNSLEAQRSLSPHYSHAIVRRERVSGIEKRFSELGAKAYVGVAPAHVE